MGRSSHRYVQKEAGGWSQAHGGAEAVHHQAGGLLRRGGGLRHDGRQLRTAPLLHPAQPLLSRWARGFPESAPVYRLVTVCADGGGAGSRVVEMCAGSAPARRARECPLDRHAFSFWGVGARPANTLLSTWAAV